MTREEVKAWLPIIQAWAEGKTIQYQINPGSRWTDIINDLYTSNPPSNYRIKPQPQYRPFNNKKECWNEMQKHHPFGWVMGKINKNFYNIDFVYSCNPDNGYGVRLSYYGEASTKYENMFKGFTFADGEPFGIKEE